jgi:hypothetical protein
VFDPALAAELAEYRAALGRRVKATVAAADQAVDDWVWTSGHSVRWSPFLYVRERDALPAEKVVRAPKMRRRGHAHGYAAGQLRLVRCFDGARGGCEFLHEPDGERTWWSEIDSGEVVGVGVLETTDGRLDRVTVVRGGQEVAWLWHQERYTWRNGRPALINKSIAELETGGLAVKHEYLEDLSIVHAADGELDGIYGTYPSGDRFAFYERPQRELSPEQFAAELTRAVVEASRLGLSRRDDVAIAYLAYLQQRTFPPDLLVLTREEVDAILADEDRDIHDIAPAEWGHAELILPYGELGYDQWLLATRVRMTEREALARSAVEQAATELAAQLPDLVVLAFDYEGQDEQLAEALDRVLAPDAPLRALL